IMPSCHWELTMPFSAAARYQCSACEKSNPLKQASPYRSCATGSPFSALALISARAGSFDPWPLQSGADESTPAHNTTIPQSRRAVERNKGDAAQIMFDIKSSRNDGVQNYCCLLPKHSVTGFPSNG